MHNTVFTELLVTNNKCCLDFIACFLRPLYQNKEKVEIIERLINKYITNLRAGNKYESSDENNSQSPSALLWALFYAGEHYDELGEYLYIVIMQTTLWLYRINND